MKKILKYLGITLASLLGLVLLLVLFINFKPLPNYQLEVPLGNLEVEINPERVSNGAELSSVLCNHCHGNKGRLEGKLIAEEEGFGKIYAPNITQDEQYGIGSYTDAELYRLLRTGVKKDGGLSLPMMMRFPTAAEKDIYSIIAFLRSNEAAVQASSNQLAEYEPTFLVKLLYTIAFKPLPLPLEEISKPGPADKHFGQYLANSLYACYNCHSASFESNNFMEPEKSAGFLGGGNPIAVGDMKPVESANITMHETDGIGSWTQDDFFQALKFGKHPEGRKLSYPMLPYAFLDSTEIFAIHDYLKTVPQLADTKNLAKINE
ncbi:MAG: cytochrome c [Bacteroidia bacterium]|nr:cytochrome c [Bacteroidia bacterium]